MPEKIKSRRPANTAFKQQRLKAWQPILTPKTVLPAFFAVGAVFIPLGVGLYLASDKVNQIIFDYTNCAKNDTSFTSPITSWTYDTISNNCTINFNVPTDFNGPVFLYYRLTNFYQNHRRYVKSFDAKQLANNPASSTTNCAQLNVPTSVDTSVYSWLNGSQPSPNAFIYPCGLIANSYFTDAIGNIQTVGVSPSSVYEFVESGIAWPSDSAKFVTMDVSQYTAATMATTVFPPPQWVAAFPGRNFSAGYSPTNFPDIASMQRFQVWMRPAGLPNFRKIWGKLDGNLPAGNYKIAITNNFNVNTYGGTKSIVISTVSILGGKNPFLGVAYIAVGSLCWVLGIVFLLRHMIKPRKPGDYTYLSWNQPQRAADGAR